MQSNKIYSSKNNEITEVELCSDREEIEDEIQKKESKLNVNDVVVREEQNKLRNNKIETMLRSTLSSTSLNSSTSLDITIQPNKEQQSQLIKKVAKQKLEKKMRKNATKPVILNTTITTTGTKITTTTLKPSLATSNTKFQRPNSLINPFGQLSAFFGSDQLQHLQDYNFLFNAERHTIFQLHTSTLLTSETTSISSNSNGNIASGRVLNVVSGSLGAAFGVNPTSVADVPPAKVEEVQLYNAASLRQSRFNPFNPTRILIHGWFGGSHAGVYNTLIPEYLKLANGTASYNIFTVDWGRGAVADYITASYRVKPVGRVVAKFIDFLHRESGMRFEDLHVIGFSMGAHIAGIAGKNIQHGRLPIIYALDPALPLFRYENIDERIALTDADYVEVIHTSVGSYGYDRPLGHVDFYVNYGYSQPGCFLNECSHFRAFQVLAESLHRPKAFRGQGCDVKLWLDMIKNRRCLMGTGRNLTMGGDPPDVVGYYSKRGGGVYYLTTNSNSPYGRN